MRVSRMEVIAIGEDSCNLGKEANAVAVLQQFCNLIFAAVHRAQAVGDDCSMHTLYVQHQLVISGVMAR